MLPEREILASVIDLEPAGGTRASGAGIPGAGAKQVTLVMVGVLALVLVAGSLYTVGEARTLFGREPQ